MMRRSIVHRCQARQAEYEAMSIIDERCVRVCVWRRREVERGCGWVLGSI